MINTIRPLLARFGEKLLTEVAPAILASVVGAFLVAQFVRSEAPKPAVVIAAPAGDEMLALLREEHSLLTEFVRKDTEAKLAANRAADADAETLRVAAVARAAERIAQVSEAAVVSASRKPVVRVAAVAEKSVAEKPVGEPLELASLRNPPTVDPTRPRPPADLAALPQPRQTQDGFLKRQLRGAVATVERVPGWLRDASDWVTGTVSAERLPSLPHLPERNLMQVRL